MVSALIALGVTIDDVREAAVLGGLIVFGIVFALNSSLHSYLILAYAGDDDVSMDVGFYYSANASGRLVGTLLSGLLYLGRRARTCDVGSAAFAGLTWLLTLRLPPLPADTAEASGSDGGLVSAHAVPHPPVDRRRRPRPRSSSALVVPRPGWRCSPW